MIVIDKIFEKNDFSCDGYIIHLEKLDTYPGKCYQIDEAISLAKDIKKAKKKVIASIDKVFSEDDLSYLQQVIYLIAENFDFIIFSDFSVEYLLKEYKEKLIYDPKTLVCSKKEVETIDTKTFISLEMSKEEVSDIIKTNFQKICYTVFGLRQMMYSRRPLLSIYNDFSGSNTYNKNVLYDLKEEMRDDLYKIIENDNGTFVFTPYFFYNPLIDFSLDDLFICRIDPYLLKEEDCEFLTSLYKENIDSVLRDNKMKEYFGKKHMRISKGFLTDKLFLLKEK